MLLSADSLTIIFVKIYCYWTRTVWVIAKGSRSPVFLRHSVVMRHAVECGKLSQYSYMPIRGTKAQRQKYH